MPGTGVNMIEKAGIQGKAYANLYHHIGKYKWIIFAAAVLSIAGAVLNPDRSVQVKRGHEPDHGRHEDVHRPHRHRKDRPHALHFLYSRLYPHYCQGIYHGDSNAENRKEYEKRYFEKINRIPLSYFDSHAVGDTLSRVSNDVDTFSQSMNQSFSTFVSSISLLLGSVLMMLLQTGSWRFSGWRLQLSEWF